MNNCKQNAFMNLYSPIHHRISAYCLTLTGNTENAKDLLGETVVTAFEKFEKIHSPEVFLHFLFGIAIRHYQNRKRKYRKIEYFDKAPKIEDNTNGFETNDNLEQLYKALNQLPENQHEAIVLFEISGFSTEEIAEMQNCKHNAVRQRLTRGRERLRKLLGVRKREKVVAMTVEPIILLFFSSENFQPISDDELDKYFEAARNQEPVFSKIDFNTIVQIKVNIGEYLLEKKPRIQYFWYPVSEELLKGLPDSIANELRREYLKITSTDKKVQQQPTNCTYFEVCRSTLFLEEMKVFPNPTKGEINLEFSTEQELTGKIALVNLAGQTIKILEANRTFVKGRHQLKLDVSDAPNGIFLLTITTDKGFRTQRVMVNK